MVQAIVEEVVVKCLASCIWSRTASGDDSVVHAIDLIIPVLLMLGAILVRV